MAGKSAILTVKILTDAAGVSKGLGTAEASYTKFTDALGLKSQTAGSKVGDKLVTGIDKALGTGLKIAGIAGGAILGTALFKGFERLNMIDQAEAKLKGLGHSGGEVAKIMDDATKAVKGTAFGLGDAAGVAAQAIAAGIQPGKDLESTLKLVADSATIAGSTMQDMGGIFAEVAASNKLQGDTVAQLTERGIPILQLLADQYGITQEAASKMVSAGEVDFANFSAAMQAGMGGAALESGKTFQGAWDNVMASMGRIGENLLKPLFEGTKNGLQGLPALMLPLEDAAKDIGQAFADMIGWLSENIGLVKALAAAAAVLVGALLAFRGVVAVMQTYQTIMTAIQGIQTAWNTITKTATAIQAAFNAVIAANPVMAIVTAIIALITALYLFFTQTELGKEIWANFTQFLSEAWANVVSFFETTITAIGDFFTAVWTNVSSFFSTVFEGFQAIVQAHGAWLLSIYTGIGDFFRSLWTGIASFFQGIWDGIQAAFAAVADFFKNVWNVAVAIVQAYFNAWRNIITTIINGVKAVVEGVANFFKSAWEGAVNAVSAVIRTLQGIFQNVFNAIMVPINAVKNAFDAVVDAVKNVINWISKIKIPDVLGQIGGMLGFSATAPQPAVATMGASLYGAPTVIGGRGAIMRSAGASGAGGITINVNGGLDSADAIARRIKTVLRGSDRRQAGIVIQRRTA